jgi:hypothetical protein
MDDAFLICGHGGEHRKTFIVPKGCIIIIHTQYGEKIDRAVYLPMIAKLHRVNINVLRDPLATEHLPILLQIYKRFTVYQEGEECPDFRYQLFDCLSSTRCNVAPMGVINMRAWGPPLSYEKTSDIAESAPKEEIIRHFSYPYRNSIIPTEQAIKNTVKEIIDQHTKQAIKDNVETIIEQRPKPLLRAIFERISEMTDKTLSELCAVRKGVYYHTLCRQKGDVTKALRRNFPDLMTLPSDITQDLIKRRHMKHRPTKNIITLKKDIEQIKRLPLSNSHTRKKANNAIARKRNTIDALTHRIGETITHRTPFIKQMMNSPVYQERRRKEVSQEITEINKMLTYFEKRLKELTEAIEKKERQEKGINTHSEKHTRNMDLPIDVLEKDVREFTRGIKRQEAMRNNLLKLQASMDASPSLSYVKENTRWKSDPELHPESPYENTHQHIIEAEQYGNRHIINSYENHLDDEREQLQRMRNAHARFNKGRNEYRKDPSGNASEQDMAYLTNEMKGYEKGIKRLEYLTNVVPPFHTSRVKIDKNEQLQGMRNAHARFTASRKKYMEDKASNSDTNQYKKNVNYFNRVLRDYEKGIRNAENPSNSYRRVKQNGTIKWVRK